MNFESLKKDLPIHILIILGFIIVSLAYSYPVLNGKTLAQNDMIQAEGATQELKKYKEKTGKYPLWTNSMFSGMPTYQVYLDFPMSLTVHVGRFFSYQMLPSPANIIFVYLLGAYLMMLMVGFNRWLSILGALAITFASYNIISIEAGHISKALAIGFAPALIGSVIMTFRGKYIVGGALTAFFTAIQLYTNHIQITYYTFLALGLFGIYALIQAILKKEYKTFGIATGVLIVAVLIGIASHASRLWTTYEYSQVTIRGKSELTSNKQSKGGLDRDYAFQWSYGIGETMTFLIPNFYGGGSMGKLDEESNTYEVLVSARVPQQQALKITQSFAPYLYWGAQPFTSGPAYLGAVVFFLFILGMVISKNPIKWWLLGVVIFFTILSWGSNFPAINYLMFDYFPLYNKFRAVTMILSVLQIFVVWVAILGIEEIINQINKEKPQVKTSATKTKVRSKTSKQTSKKSKSATVSPEVQSLQKSLMYSLIGVGGILLLFALMPSMFLSFRTATQMQDTQDGQKVEINKDRDLEAQLVEGTDGNEALAQDIVRGIQDDRKSLLRADAWRSLIFVLIIGGLLWAFINGFVAKTYFYVGLSLIALVDLWNIDQRYLDKEDFVKKSEYKQRFNPTPADKTILTDKDPHFRVMNLTVGTFQDATTSYYHKSIGGYHGAKFRRYQELIENQISKNNSAVVNMLNTKYLIFPRDRQVVAEKNPNAMGNVWFVESYKIVQNADEEMKSLDKFEPEKVAFIDKRYNDVLQNLDLKFDPKASIKLIKYSPDKLVYESNAKSPQVAIFSEIYYNEGRGWNAYVDGKPQAHFRANYVLRGMVVPAGKHTITFKFEPQSFYTGEIIALIASFIIFGALGFAFYTSLKEEKEEHQ